MSMFRVVKYSDVSKNDEGNWIVNDLEKTDVLIDSSSKFSRTSICRQLSKAGLISTLDMRRFVISDLDKSIIEIKRKKDLEPICRLERSSF